jgi:glutathione peroxidase
LLLDGRDFRAWARETSVASIFDFSAESLGGDQLALSQFQGNVLLVVNTASKCGFTPQYQGLEALYRAHKDRGFAVLGFPCNQFGSQEPGTAADIASFCARSYDVTFPMFAKIDVNGDNAHPLYRFLKEQKPGVLGSQAIKWNFTKFLVDRAGQVVARHAPTTLPEALSREIEDLLDAPRAT